MSANPRPRRTRSSSPCIAQVVGKTFTALCTAGGNNSSGYQHPPISAKTMPNMMLKPVACPSVFTNAPSVTPNAAAASAAEVRTTNNASGACPHASFITKIPNSTSSAICASAISVCPRIVPNKYMAFDVGVTRTRRSVPC
ncbi:MAG: hypothetical protein PGMFKBFP_03006 [Anaerolineales bacterium]|nr:hypothetical protein [Anaerolineales bacterium]